MNKLERLQTIDPDVLQNFLKTRRSAALPEDLQDYIIKINAVPSIVHHQGANMTRVVRALQKQFPAINYSTARDIYYDAMNFFHIDDTITVDAWDNYYADKMEDLARVSIALDKLDTAKRCYDKAHEFRTKAAERIKVTDWQVPVFIITNKVKHTDLGFEKKSLHDIVRKDEDGFYINLINSLETSDKEKKRLIREANIVDVEHEEVMEDE
ncbi:MAG: hypothetical protein BGO30_08130 [Bacteroidetes bacterium 41-46]|jgi:hypothetical protein|nr:MAG: hypothetical protein BGO30_08130 [Bacteroidetes bacterium 41-46]